MTGASKHGFHDSDLGDKWILVANIMTMSWKNTLPCDTLRVIVPSILLYSIHMHEKFIAEQRTSLRFF